jgi:hypothetical protein
MAGREKNEREKLRKLSDEEVVYCTEVATDVSVYVWKNGEIGVQPSTAVTVTEQGTGGAVGKGQGGPDAVTVRVPRRLTPVAN